MWSTDEGEATFKKIGTVSQECIDNITNPKAKSTVMKIV